MKSLYRKSHPTLHDHPHTNRPHSKFFPPASEEEAEEGEISAKDEVEDASKAEGVAPVITSATAQETAEDAAENPAVKDLPDVPTTEPMEEGQPEAKKAKLDDEVDGEGTKEG